MQLDDSSTPRKSFFDISEHSAALIAACFGISLFIWRAGLFTIDPTNIGWLITGDWAQHFIGWSLFRNEPWKLPLGSIPGIMYPMGSSIGFMDSIPWLAILFRPFSSVLPEHFQYIGPWLALCHGLQGFFGAKIAKLLTPDRLTQALCGFLFASTPVMLGRVGHDALTAQWLLLAAFWLFLYGAKSENVVRQVFSTALLLVLSAGIHPYLMAMQAGLSLAIALRFWLTDRALKFRGFIISCFAIYCPTILTLILFGYIQSPKAMSWSGFGFYSANLVAFVDPMGWSFVWPAVKIKWGQYEGFAFLGSGFWLLALLAIIESARNRKELLAKRHILIQLIPLLAVCLAMAFFAFSPVLTFGKNSLLNLSFLYRKLEFITGPFRTNGRFIWPLHYFLQIAILGLIVFRFAPNLKTLRAIIAIAALIQVLDQHTEWYKSSFSKQTWSEPNQSEWKLARNKYKHLALYPPQLVFEGSTCTRPAQDHYVKWSYLAYQLRLTINSGRPARIDPVTAAQLCDQPTAEIRAGNIRPDTIYVVDDKHADDFKQLGERAICGHLDESLICVANDRKTDFASAISKR